MSHTAAGLPLALRQFRVFGVRDHRQHAFVEEATDQAKGAYLDANKKDTER
jgi:hypothetical protein